MNSFYLKIILPSIISILLFALTIFIVIIPQYRQSILTGKQEMIKELTNSASSILSKYESDERNGLITRDEAQKTAISRIQYLRYGEDNKDYFWITDMHPNMIVHPYRPDLNGKDLTDFSDPHGKKLFVECVKTVNESEHGYVEYMWQWKDDSMHIVPKLSYVKMFKPWGWIIGTGVYIEDVNKEINSLTNKLIWISVLISILIALLLLFISQQSLKIERKRIEAENELHESKEKYRTLVEASTEGLIMLVKGRISFLNSIISKITGFEPDELVSAPLQSIISENNSKTAIDTFSGKSVKEGKYEINLKQKSGGFSEVLITSSTANLNGESVNVLIVKDLSIEKESVLSDIDYQRLVNILNIGFFRARFDQKGKILYANETAIKILGFEHFKDLSELNIFELPVETDDKKILRKNLVESGFVKNKVFNILRKNNELAVVSVTIVAIESKNEGKLVCEGIIEDLTSTETEKRVLNDTIVKLKSANFLIEQNVKNFVTPVTAISSESTIGEAANMLSKRKADCLLLKNQNNEYIGIITDSDIQKRVVALDLHPDNQVYLIMSSPIIYFHENASLLEVINSSEEKRINHAVIKNSSGEVTGTLSIKGIFNVLKDSLSFFIEEVKNAETIGELKEYYRKLQLFIRPLILSDISVNHITSVLSSFSDAVTRKVIEIAIEVSGKPPAAFSFISMGSEGRKEETLYTDQDNAIIYSDVQEENSEEVRLYFNKLGETVCNSLNQIGYSFCKGNIMAKNHQWCQPLNKWKDYFTDWITTPEPQNLLDATIFFDFRNVYGDEELTDNLRKTIDGFKNRNSLFLYHMAHNAFNTKFMQLPAGYFSTDKNSEPVDLKNAVSPVIMFARIYCLQNNIWHTNTHDRLEALKERNILNESTAVDLIFVYDYLLKLRFKNQANLLNHSLPVSNTINIKRLPEIEQSILKKVLSLIPSFQNRIGTDFRINV